MKLRPRPGPAALAALALAAAAPLAPAPVLAQPRADAQTAQHGVPVQEVVSPGGVRAWLVSDSTVPIIQLRAYWRGGGASEPDEIVGATAIMADMLGEGAGSYDANAFKERLEELHVSLSYSAGVDGVGLSLQTLSEHRDAAFDLVRLTLAEPRFDDAPLARIKRQVAVSIRQRDTNPGYIANLALDQALTPGHPYARRVSNESLARIDADILRARRDALVTRAGLRVTVVGDISADALAPLLDHMFGVLPEGAPVAEPVQATPAAATPLIVRPLPQPQSLILFAAPGIQDEDSDFIPLAVANYILGGGGFSSRLMDEVREKRGLVYGIGTGPAIYDQLALFRGSAQTENDDVREALEVIRAEVARIYADGATQKEVDDAIAYLTGSFALSLDSNRNIAGVLHSYHVQGRAVGYVNERNDLIRAVTLDDVNRVIRRLFNPDAFTYVVVGQPTGLEAVMEASPDRSGSANR
ncbi:MAG: insulinase family protein [Alphaproteobacteria bacterium]|nr:insulinase family protein [Alphaproteobacteria bacterium]